MNDGFMLPKVIQDEKDPEVLKAYFSFIVNENDQLKKEIVWLREEKAKKDQQLLNLDDKLVALRKQTFGKGSEKRSSSRPKTKGKKELTLHGASFAPAPSEEEFGKLKTVKVDHELSSSDLADIAEEYGHPRDSEWEHLNGFYDESEEVDVVVQSYVRKTNRRHKYRLKKTKGSDDELIVTAPASKKIIKSGKYSTEFAVEVVASKYLYHLPLERIRRQMSSAGLTIAVNTLYTLCFYVHCYLEDLVQKIQAEIIGCGLALHLDETKWPINNKKQSNGYMWVMSNAAGSYYQFEPSRSGAIAKELIGSYEGPVVTDGFSGYKSKFKNLKRINLAFCWAHGRRKFTDIEKNYPRECTEILDLMEKLFRIERMAKDFDELKEKRGTESKQIIDDISAWLLKHKPQARGESELLKAINYMMNHWTGLTKFLDDVRIPLTNNEVERTIRHSVMGRKNFYGSRTINGADITATLYTIVESCKKVELEPKAYILMAVKKKIAGMTPPTPLEYARQIRADKTV